MSKITEYISLFLKGLPHTKEILDSVIKNVQLNYGSLPEEEKAEIIKRRVICETCPFMSRNAVISKEYFELTGKHYKAFRRVDHCSFCGCGIETRTASLDSNCGIETWNSNNSTKTIPLKWTKFETNGQSTEN